VYPLSARWFISKGHYRCINYRVFYPCFTATCDQCGNGQSIRSTDSSQTSIARQWSQDRLGSSTSAQSRTSGCQWAAASAPDPESKLLEVQHAAAQGCGFQDDLRDRGGAEPAENRALSQRARSFILMDCVGTQIRIVEVDKQVPSRSPPSRAWPSPWRGESVKPGPKSPIRSGHGVLSQWIAEVYRYRYAF
jgi:hypothetical protein